MSVSALKPAFPRFGAAAVPQAEREYHCHIYYDPDTQQDAQAMLKTLQDSFQKELGDGEMEVTDTKAPSGPHLKPNLMIEFRESALGPLILLLNEHIGNLLAMLHPETNSGKGTSTGKLRHANPFWIGIPAGNMPLNSKFFDKK